MKQSSTQLLMRHLYNETEPTEKQAINEAFQKNFTLKEIFESYVETKQLLDYARLNAPQYVVNGVLQFSKETLLETAN